MYLHRRGGARGVPIGHIHPGTRVDLVRSGHRKFFQHGRRREAASVSPRQLAAQTREPSLELGRAQHVDHKVNGGVEDGQAVGDQVEVVEEGAAALVLVVEHAAEDGVDGARHLADDERDDHRHQGLGDLVLHHVQQGQRHATRPPANR